MEEDTLSNLIIGAAIEVHKQLGRGLLESAYAGGLAVELDIRVGSLMRRKKFYQ
jgi:GxxExxY protein